MSYVFQGTISISLSRVHIEITTPGNVAIMVDFPMENIPPRSHFITLMEMLRLGGYDVYFALNFGQVNTISFRDGLMHITIAGLMLSLPVESVKPGVIRMLENIS